jgi:hypothetical protein
MYKTIVLTITCVLFFGCEDMTTTTKTKLHFDDFEPFTEFDGCLELETFQLLGAAKLNLEKFISNNLIDETENLATGYERYCLAWTGQFGSDLDTEVLLNSASSQQLLAHPSYKDIWVQLTALGDTVYTEEVVLDENGHSVVMKYIENYWTLNTQGSYFKCLSERSNSFVQNYLYKKEYGEVEPYELAFELYKSVGIQDFDDPIIQNIIVTDLYLRLIAVRQGS